MIGYKNEFFEVVGFFDKNVKRGTNIWICLCKCGNTVNLETNVIKKVKTKSCGCSRKGMGKGNTNALKHGLTKHKGPFHPLYAMRNRIMTRCYNSKKSDFKYYQGKGIKVFQDWIDDPKKFYDWALLNGWKKDMTIDRVDSNKDYSPENCRFVSQVENLKNMHKSKRPSLRKPSK